MLALEQVSVIRENKECRNRRRPSNNSAVTKQSPSSSSGDRHNNNNTSLRRASLVAQMVKNLPAMQEPWVEKGMATHSNTLAWRSPRTEEPGGLSFMGWQRVRHDLSN